MITSLSEYKFVTGENIDAEHPHGDMDRILIDGGVMPLRPEASQEPLKSKSVLRGEDVAFLIEAWGEKYQYFSSGPRNDVFSRKLGKSLGEIMPGVCNWAKYRCISKDILEPRSNVSQNFWQEEIVPRLVKESDLVDTTEFSRNKQLRRDHIIHAFNDLKITDNLMRQTTLGYWTTLYREHENINPDYPWNPASTLSACYRSYGGSDEHGHYGGYDFEYFDFSRILGKYMNDYPDETPLPFDADPESASIWQQVNWSYKYENLQTGESEDRVVYHWMKLCDGVVSDHKLEFNIPASTCEQMLLDCMDYYGVSKGFVEPNVKITCSVMTSTHLPIIFIQVGDHTKWWS